MFFPPKNHECIFLLKGKKESSNFLKTNNIRKKVTTASISFRSYLTYFYVTSKRSKMRTSNRWKSLKWIKRCFYISNFCTFVRLTNGKKREGHKDRQIDGEYLVRSTKQQKVSKKTQYQFWDSPSLEIRSVDFKRYH